MKNEIKQGDFAVLVVSQNGNEGTVVRCLEKIYQPRTQTENRLIYWPRWVIDFELETTFGDIVNSLPEKNLMKLVNVDRVFVKTSKEI